MRCLRVAFFVVVLVMAQYGISQIILVSNPTEITIKDYVAEIPVKKLSLKLGIYSVIDEYGKQLPLEIVSDLAGEMKAVFPVEEIAPHSTLRFQISLTDAVTYPKRTYAELAHKLGNEYKGKKYEDAYSWVKPNYMFIPGSFRDHAYYIKYEGPGWESDKIAYRFYLDQRNAIDAFGKKTPEIVLPNIGVDGYDNYHKMGDWGMDHMRVGKSLGIASIAYWDGKQAIRIESRDSVICYIPADGKVRSQVNTTYYGWQVDGAKTDLRSLISIDAGSRASHMEINVGNSFDNITTGIIKNKDTELIKPNTASMGEWTYLATFGNQSMNDNDIMGLAVFYRKKQLKMLTEDALNHLVVLTPNKGGVEYYFMVTWEHDFYAVKDKASFLEQVTEVLNRLNYSPEITVKR